VYDVYIWEDGTKTVLSGGPLFSEVHPEITDPEYYLKDEFFIRQQALILQALISHQEK